ncbi:MAG: UDP-N-acetylglucosamine 1-carboxyvinyltransferase [Elusimicrobia bacterium]|nr:UDP-N-acetylglucosamine 1-carboxyvinyltransferase [Elusimicrobiota bacterium]
MDSFAIDGGHRLSGEIKISGSKNAALPIIAASLLTVEKCEISNVPDLMDIKTSFDLLNHLGKKCCFGFGTFSAQERGSIRHHAPYDLVRRMRASVLVAGALLARFKKARFSLPGGCSIGVRPIDIHLEAFKKLGAEITYERGDVALSAKKLRPAKIKFRFPSVGATENLMMAATLVAGTTVLENCAMEPEIIDLAGALRSMGARIEGDGTARIKIKGVSKLSGLKHRVIPDRIETGTFMIMCAAAGGRLRLVGAEPGNSAVLIKALRKSGVSVSAAKDAVLVESSGLRPAPVNVKTEPHPGFPTDLQAVWMAYMARCRGKCEIEENIFENRFIHAAELMRMGASIYLSNNKAFIHGADKLTGAPVMASDIRAGAGLITAALAAKGQSFIRRVYHIDRGYERIEEKLKAVGAKIERIRS